MRYQALPVAAFVAGISTSSTANAYTQSTGPCGTNWCSPSSYSSFRNRDSFSTSPRSNRYRQRQERIDKAFRDLQDEMKNNPRWNKKKMGQFDFMMMDPFSVDFQDVDKEAVKKWVDKAFDLASEFNKDFSKNQQELETNDELLQKSREWVENVYTSTQEDAEDETVASSSSAVDELTVKKTNNDEDPDTAPLPGEPDIVTPYSENRSDDETFQVVVDLPGVDRSDVDLSLEKEFLVVEAERRSQGVDGASATRKYVKKFAVVEEEIEVDKIDATLNNGVLIVSAPKKKKEEEKKIKIPLSS